MSHVRPKLEPSGLRECRDFPSQHVSARLHFRFRLDRDFESAARKVLLCQRHLFFDATRCQTEQTSTTPDRMSSNSNYKLSQEQIDHFMKYGYVRVPDCFSREKAAAWTADVWTRLGFSPTDKTTWTTECTHMPDHKEESVKSFAPKAWAAICELLGGESRVAVDSATWNDAFIVNLGTAETEGQWPHPVDLQGWHVDGDFFVHFLDSPEQGLLVIPLFTDIQEHAGGTMVCADAVKEIATHLVSVSNVLSGHITDLDSSMITRRVCPPTWSRAAANYASFSIAESTNMAFTRPSSGNATSSTR